jgi:hypothetical protein
MKDLGIITDGDNVQVLDAETIQQAKKRVWAITVNEREPDLKELTCTGLDGKKSQQCPYPGDQDQRRGWTQSFFETIGSF